MSRPKLPYRVYDVEGQPMAHVSHSDAAAVLVGVMGGSVRYKVGLGSFEVWGLTEEGASESYDDAAMAMAERVEAKLKERGAKG